MAVVQVQVAAAAEEEQVAVVAAGTKHLVAAGRRVVGVRR